MPTTLINVSNRLPVTVGEEQITKSSGGLVAALAGLSAEEYALQWIGWPGGEVADPARRQEIERVLREEHGCIPVFLSAEEAEAHYEGFSNSSVWPLLHYMPNYLRYEPAWWEHYRNVNQRFADQVLEIAGEGDLVWVHDYQLLLLPAMLKAARPSLRIGFFLHTPFPAFEIFRCHPRRGELVAGMLGADRIGFHTFGYLRHFRDTVQRLLGFESELTRVRGEDGGRSSALGVYPIGIHAARFAETLDSPEFAAARDRFRDTNQGKQTVLSVERMDYTKGILHRLDAMENFLAAAEDRDAVKFIFVSVPSREGIEEYQALVEEVESRVGRLNGKYATLHHSPIHFIHGSVEFTDLCALYATADVALVTPLIDGMNLVAKEFLACQRDNAGFLILSEFAGAAEELFNALIVNPYDTQAVADSLREALALPAEEKRRRNQPMRDRVMRHDAQRWARSFIEDLAATAPAETPAAEGSATHLGAAKTQLARALAERQRVALFLDYDGTLREIERDPAAARPSAAVRATLDAWRDRPGVDVYLISGRTRDDLEAFLGDLPFGLIAEHGATLRRHGGREWEELDRTVSYAWKDELLPMLRRYEDATPGSHVEEKRASLVWHYRRADREFGDWKANQLAEELTALAAHAPLQVRHGKKIVEVSSAEVSKGAAVSRLLQEAAYDLALCAGDDQTDESMFRLATPNLLTVKIGEGSTQATYRAASPAVFRQFLDAARA